MLSEIPIDDPIKTLSILHKNFWRQFEISLQALLMPIYDLTPL